MNVIENLDILSVAVAVAGTFVLGFTIFFTDRKSITNKSFLLFSLITGVWGLVNFFGYRLTDSNVAFLLLRLVMFLAILQAFSIFQLFYVFPNATIIFPKVFKYFLIPFVLLTAAISASPLVLSKIKEVSAAGNITKITNGPAIPLFGMVSIALVFSALFIFIRNLHRAKNKQLIRAYIKILIGTALMFGMIITFNFILPAVFENSKYLPFGALFTFPFVILTTYAILYNRLFNIKVFSTSILVFLLSIVLFLEIIFADSLVLIIFRSSIFLLVLIFGINLIRSVLREVEQKEKLAKLNMELQLSIKQRESLVHLVTHKVKGSFTRTKFLFAGILDGTFGPITPEIKKRAEQGLEFDNNGIQTVDLVLNVANLQNGIIKYDMKVVDFKDIVIKTVEEKKIGAEAKGLKIETDIKDGIYNTNGDIFWLKEAVNNLIENSIKYTKEGTILVKLEDGNGKIKLSVKDSGIGITEEDKQNLFTEGGRGKDSVRINVDSTGYGLYTVKLIIEAHKGTVSAESEGAGKGSTFHIELSAV
ncbi:MAG: ATP-binding protein [Candidatus Paceibacterota bacterium]|jgi:signal transduction histidine kinase